MKLYKVEKTGLLDRVEDEALQKSILKGMRNRSAYYLILKVGAGEPVLLKTGHYIDKNWVASRSDSIQGFVASSSEDFI